jgi:hypothetical protein
MMKWHCEVCDEKGENIPVKVCRSAAGFYIGQFCDGCGPYSRLTGYFGSREVAEEILRIEEEAGSI